MPTLSELGLESSAHADPLSYPGTIPDRSGLLVDDWFVELRATDGMPVGSYTVQSNDGSPLPRPSNPLEPLSLDETLLALGVATVDDRHPLLAVGSNAAPGQIRSKFDRSGVTTALPMLRCTVDGWRRTILAHVSIPGYLPITLEPDPGARSLSVSLLLCDGEQLAAIDATEPNYRRLTAADDVPLTLDSGERLCGYLVYVGRRGSVRAAGGSIMEFTTQEAAIAGVSVLLSDELRAACGPDAQSFVAATAADPALRDRIRDHLAPAMVPEPTDVAADPPTYADLRRPLRRSI